MLFNEFNEFKEYIEDIADIDFDFSKITSGEKSFISVNRKIAIEITHFSSCYNTSEAIEVLDEDYQILGMICFPSINHSNFNSISEWDFSAKIIGCYKKENLESNQKLPEAYFVIEEEKIDKYIDSYFDTAPLWGYFSHKDTSAPLLINREKIFAFSNINFPTTYHEEKACLALQEKYSHGRYLKLYHLLELLFDFDFVNDVKEIDGDLQQFGKLMKEYGRDDINRLTYVLKKRIFDKLTSSNILEKMEKIKDHEGIATIIFQEYSKDSNPIKENGKFEELLKLANFSQTELKTVFKNQCRNIESYQLFLIKLIVYWLYRIRCCIAHNKIGEYIITIAEEKFVLDFGENLLREVIKTSFESE